MGSIHGLSHKALKHFRKKPAALAVYWIYVSRTNNEGVSWPTIRGLKRDTGWAADTCAEARAWLVEHKALDPVKDYIPPAWRNLDPKLKTQRVNLDQSEYYRPTGYIIIGDTKFHMLYFGAMEVSDIETHDDKDVDVLPDRTSSASNNDSAQQRSGSTELDSSISELDTINTNLDSTKDSAPIGAPTKLEEKPDAVKQAEDYVNEIEASVTKKQRKPNPNQPIHDALLACWGLTPETVTRTGDKVYWIATADLADINFPIEAIRPLHNWCKSQNWPSLTVMAMAKYAGQFLSTWKKPVTNGNPAHHRVHIEDEVEASDEQKQLIREMMKATQEKLLVSDRNKNGR